MKVLSTDLIQDLILRTTENIQNAEQFLEYSEEQLNQKQSSQSWSALECFEHLNYYSSYYIPEIENRISSSKHSKAEYFKSGILGNYFAKSMLPKEKLNKMKTFKSTNPLGSKLTKETLNQFINDQKMLLDLLEQSKEINLTKTKTSISISKFIKLRLGDTFRVLIYHNQRHIIQAQKAIEV